MQNTTTKNSLSFANRQFRTLDKGIRQAVMVLTLFVLGSGVGVISLNAALPNMVEGQSVPSLAPVIKRTSPAVVNIQTRGSVKTQNQNPFFNDPFFEEFFGRRQQPQRRQTQSAGSGVIVDASKGLILTNHHVIENADEITVQLQDGT